MKKQTHYINLSTMRVHKDPPQKRRIWMYQLPDDKPQKIIKKGRWWYYNTGTGETGCDSLAGAKGDLKHMGAKVWSALQ